MLNSRKEHIFDMTTLELNKMSRAEKLQAMETLWSDLSQDETNIKSPSWHANALKDTEQRVASGLEIPISWGNAKKKLRSRFK